MRRIASLLGVLLALVLVGVVAVPATPAYAFACISSVTCNPANVPLLVDPALVNIGGKAVLAPVSEAAGSTVASVKANAVAGSLLAGFAGLLGLNLGMFGQDAGSGVVAADYDVGESDALCAGESPTALTATQMRTLQPTCNVVPITSKVGGVFVPAGSVRVAVTTEPVGASTKVSATVTRTAGVANQLSQVVNTGIVTLQCVSQSGNSATPSTFVYAWMVDAPRVLEETCLGHWAVTGTVNTAVGGPADVPGRSVLGSDVFGMYAAPANTEIDGQVRTRVECVPNGGGSRYYEMTTRDFLIGVDDPLPIPSAYCHPGDLAIGSTVEWKPTGNDTWEVVGTATAPPEVESWAGDYPLCYGLAPVVCELSVYRVGQGGELESCGKGASYCEGWASGTLEAITAAYRCRFGPYTVDINLCSAFRDPALGVLPNTDEDGNVIPVTAPPPATVPGPVVTPDEAADLGWDQLIDTEGGVGSDCWPTGWGVLNPLEWVFKPVGCALEWAFVPSPAAVDAAGASVLTAVDEGVLGDVGTIQTAMVAPFLVTGGGCEGPPFRVNMQLNGGGFDQTYYPLSSCDPFMATVALFFRTASGGIVLVGAGLAAIRYFASVFGFVGAGSLRDSGIGSAGGDVKFKDKG